VEAHNHEDLLAGIAGLVLMVSATPAMAYVVEITTSIELTGIADKAQLREAVASAVDDVVNNAIAFAPTVVTVQSARVVGERMYILLLIADEDGEKTLATISAEASGRGDAGGITRED